MPKTKLMEVRTDFSGGLNVTDSLMNLNPNEFSQFLNAKTNAGLVQSADNAILKRKGTQRTHNAVIGVVGNRVVRGIFQWDSPTGLQVVAVAGGRFYWKNNDFDDFTEVIPGTAINNARISWQPFRANSSGAPLVLYFTAGGQVWKWTGSALSKIDGINNVPAASVLRSYGTRMFMAGVALFPKNIYWSKIGDAENFTTGGVADGGSAMVDVLAGDAISSLETFGSSLFIFTQDSIVRLTGVSNDDIQIDQDVSGLAGMLGARHINTTVVTDVGIIVLTQRGVYLIDEQQIVFLSAKIQSSLNLFLSYSSLDVISVFTDNMNSEVYIWTDQGAYVYNYRKGSWRQMNVRRAVVGARFRGSTITTAGDRSIIGGDDGFVCLTEGISNNDDTLPNGTGGVGFSASIIPAPFLVSPINFEKIVIKVELICTNLSTTDATTFTIVVDNKRPTSGDQSIVIVTVPINTDTATFRADFSQHVRWGTVQIVDDVTDDSWAIHAIQIVAYETGRDS